MTLKFKAYRNRPSKMKLCWRQEIFFENFDFINECKNEFEDDNEESCSWSKNRVSLKTDFKAVWPRNGHADSVGVKFRSIPLILAFRKFSLSEAKKWLEAKEALLNFPKFSLLRWTWNGQRALFDTKAANWRKPWFWRLSNFYNLWFSEFHDQS